MKKQNKLGIDLHQKDDLMSGFTFEDIIITLQCNEPIINEAAVKRIASEMLQGRLEDYEAMLNQNIAEILKQAGGNS